MSLEDTEDAVLRRVAFDVDTGHALTPAGCFAA